MNNNNGRGTKVHAVKNVCLSFIKTDRGVDALLIVAEGEVTSTGRTNPELVPYIYVQPPPDGTWDFAFVADPPQENSQPGLTLSAKYIVTDVPDWLTGVRVHAKTNSKEAHFK